MAVEIIECEQNSPQWLQARIGLPTCSAFSKILAKGEGKTRKAYLNRLAAETITGEPLESFSNQAMERGHALEPEARTLYSFMTNVEPKLVGFVKNGSKGGSPDSFLGDDGILEVKTQSGDLLIETLFKNEFPSTHKAQCQGLLWVTEREWLDIAIYWPKMPMFVKRTGRDEVFIAELSREVDRFNEELAETVERVRRYGEAGR